jgi:PPOX class probable F420-dependent enzyme
MYNSPVEALSPEALAFLERQRVARLATVDESGQPHAVPICFAVLGGRICTVIDQKPKRGQPGSLRRVRNILANPRVCLVFDEYDEDWSHLAWLQIRGRASLLEEPHDRGAALEALRVRYPQYCQMHLNDAPIIAIEPERIVMWTAACRA